jgi:hypothetical protein
MQVIEYNKGHIERQILVGMIISDAVLSKITSCWTGSMFASKYSNVIATMCVNYCKRHNKAPNKDIVNLFAAWSENRKDKATIDLVDSFLSSLSSEYEEGVQNPDYLIDLAGEHFLKVKIEKLIETATGHIEDGKVNDAYKTLASLHKVEMGKNVGTHLFIDKKEVYKAFERNEEVLIKYPDGLGKFFKYTFQRETLVSFMGHEGIGKTWWLIDIAYRAMLQRRKVAFFEVGDMSRSQIIQRFMVRVSGTPMWPGKYDIPVSLVMSKVGGGVSANVQVRHEEKVFKTRLDAETAWAACEEVVKHKVKSNDSYFYLNDHSTGSVTVEGIRSELQELERNDWRPDVIIIDYADILADPTTKLDKRDQINENWMQLKKMSMDLHCLVITATQSNRASYTAQTVKMEHSSEDKRKLSHVNYMIGINQNEPEKELGLMRLNYVKAREMDFKQSRCCQIAGNLSLGNPAILSYFDQSSAKKLGFDPATKKQEDENAIEAIKERGLDTQRTKSRQSNGKLG